MENLEKAMQAQGKLEKLLMGNFNKAALPPVNMVGIGKDFNGHYVLVGLERQPTVEEKKQLPLQCDGIRVKYQINGPINAYLPKPN